jgi:hypothetical protein
MAVLGIAIAARPSQRSGSMEEVRAARAAQG